MNQQWPEPRTNTYRLPPYIRDSIRDPVRDGMRSVSTRHVAESDQAYHERLLAFVRQSQEREARAARGPLWMDDFPPREAYIGPLRGERHVSCAIKPALITAPTPRPLESGEMHVQLSCTVCQEQIADIALNPCGHLVMCRWCSERHATVQIGREGATCPLCRASIKSRLRIWGLEGGRQPIANDSNDSSGDEATVDSFKKRTF